ncbi:MAG: hypothetical protein HZB21_02475 [Deltaproteobacteria bacterium]|nr:hypothetical protein [Deltaproteobacteria bacterium]
MQDIDRIKAHYNFTASDVKNLTRLNPVMEKYKDEFVVEFYNHVKRLEDAGRYLKDEAIVKRHQDALKIWFMNLFSGDYGRPYFSELEKVGLAHVKIALPAHYVNASFHFVKQHVKEILHKEIADPQERVYIERSLGKILDINLDIFTSSYIEEEKKFFLSQKVESYLVQAANRFSHGLNLVLVLGLVVLGATVIWLFIYDLYHILDGNIEKGLLSTLGSLLMLWLVASLKTGEVEAQLSLVAGVAVLGVIYWLVSKSDR